MQVEALAAPACLALLAVLDTGVSEHGAVQAAADRLLTATIDRAASLLRDADVRSDAGVQAALLELLGPLQGVLNDGRLRRPLFGKLPFEALRVRLLSMRSAGLLAWRTCLLVSVYPGCGKHTRSHTGLKCASLHCVSCCTAGLRACRRQGVRRHRGHRPGSILLLGGEHGMAPR